MLPSRSACRDVGERAAETFVKVDLGLPAEGGAGLRRVEAAAAHLACAGVLEAGFEGSVADAELAHGSGEVEHGGLDAAADVDRAGEVAALGGEQVRAHDVTNVDEVAGLLAVTEDQ